MLTRAYMVLAAIWAIVVFTSLASAATPENHNLDWFPPDTLTPAGKQRISQLMLGSFFSDPDQLENFQPSIRNKIERLAGPLAATEGEGDYALTPHVRDAVGLIEAARAHGMPIQDFIHQSGPFTSQQYSPEAQAIAHGLTHGKQSDLGALLKDYTEHARYAGNYQGPGMFNEFPAPLSPRGAFNAAFGTSSPAD